MKMSRQRWSYAFALTLLVLVTYAIYEVLSEKTLTISTQREDTESCGAKPCDSAKPAEGDDDITLNVIITFVNAKSNVKLQETFGVTVESLLRHATKHVTLFLIGDSESREVAQGILDKRVADITPYTLQSLDVDVLGKDLEEIIRPMQEQFSFKAGSYYNHVLFFLSVALHKVMPGQIRRVIMLDADLKFTDDIVKLYNHFNSFTADNVIGIAREGQPVYRHTFWKYRQDHPKTRVGDPPPDGLTGFNSGVLLLDLEKMRASELYNSLLTSDSIKRLSTEYGFKGHLGDQDFFTLIGMAHEQLFHVLPCQWNRQLCTWWRQQYASIFDLYHRCDEPIKIYHGNCQTPIP